MKRVVIILAFLCSLSASACRAGFIRQNSPVTEEQTNPQKIDPQTEEKPEPQVEPKIENVTNPENIIEEKTQDSSGRLVRVQIYGDELIREEVEVNGIPVKRTTLRGNAVVLHNGVRIQAPLIVIEGGVRGACTGGVVIADPTNGMSIYAERGDYDRQAQTVILSGFPRMVSEGKGRKPAVLTSGRMVRKMADSVSVLEGDVRIATEGWTIVGENAVFADKDKKIDLPGDPMIFGNGQFITGNTLSYFTEERKLVLHGDIVNIRREDNSIVADKKQPTLEQYVRSGERDNRDLDISGPGTLTADEITHDFKDKENVKTIVRGNVLFTREGLRIAAPSLESIGSSATHLIAREGVDSTDHKQNLHITAGKMVYERASRMLKLEQDPKIEFLKKDSVEVTGSLSGALIERNFETKQTIARGNVRLVQSDVTAVGQKAVFQEDTGAVVIEGEPGIEQEKGIIRCEKIVYYPEKKRLLLMNRIRGSLAKD